MKKIIIGIIILAIIIFGFVVFNKPSTVTGDIQLTGETKVFEITAKNWEFSPSLIEVNLGDKVELHLESIEGTHGFALLNFGVSETLELGNDVHVEFIADKSGEFNFFCSVFCGVGHGGMTGTLIVN